MGELLVVRAKIKDACEGYNVAGDLADALSEKMEMALKDAVERAESNGRKTVMSKDVPFCFACKPKKRGDTLIVKSRLKESVKDCNVAGDLSDALSDVAAVMLKMACDRAEGNGRKTVMAKDL